MQRLRGKGTSVLGSFALPQFKRKALNSFSAVQDSYLSAKDLFERHRVVFTIGTSVASVATAWGGYCLRHLYESKVNQRLEAIEKAMKNNIHIEQEELKKLVDPGTSSFAKLFATAGTTFVVGYGFGWRGGRWYANRKFRKEQMKMLGQVKPRRWQLLGQVRPMDWQFQFLKRRLKRHKAPESGVKESEKALHAVSAMQKPGNLQQSCLNKSIFFNHHNIS